MVAKSRRPDVSSPRKQAVHHDAGPPKACEANASEDSSVFKIKKQLSLLDSTMLIVCIVIGSGIFISPTWVLYYSGSVGLSLIIWLACGVCSLLGALCMAELGTTIPKFGGHYIYLYEIFGPLLAFLYIWVLIIILIPTSVAIILLVFAEYIVHPIFGGCAAVPQMVNRLLAVAAIMILTGLNCASVRWSARVTNVLSYTKLIATAIIIGVGIYYLSTGHTENFEDGFADSTTSVGNIVLALYSGLWAYTGSSNLNSVTEEIKNVPRNLPLAIIISVTLVTAICLLCCSYTGRNAFS
ncbi:Y+L amino acid transporter 2-like [Ptychodera flava]|uniref:Y+L amino acid transporter 2-like n=1 Tax=Ptychodera flava TaxID=63121 RepID=UPI003969FC78